MKRCSITHNRNQDRRGGWFLRRRSERGHPPKSRAGAAVVELALVTPFLLALTLGICELGQAYRIEAILASAARAGSTSATRAGCSNVDVSADVQAVMASNGLASNLATVTVLVNDVPGDVAAATINDKITVTVSVPTSRVIMVNMLTYLGVNSVLSQSLTMLKQG